MRAARISVEVPISRNANFNANDYPLVVIQATGRDDEKSRELIQVTGEINAVITFLWSAWHSSATEVLTALRGASSAE